MIWCNDYNVGLKHGESPNPKRHQTIKHGLRDSLLRREKRVKVHRKMRYNRKLVYLYSKEQHKEPEQQKLFEEALECSARTMYPKQ